MEDAHFPCVVDSPFLSPGIDARNSTTGASSGFGVVGKTHIVSHFTYTSLDKTGGKRREKSTTAFPSSLHLAAIPYTKYLFPGERREERSWVKATGPCSASPVRAFALPAPSVTCEAIEGAVCTVLNSLFCPREPGTDANFHAPQTRPFFALNGRSIKMRCQPRQLRANKSSQIRAVDLANLENW